MVSCIISISWCNRFILEILLFILSFIRAATGFSSVSVPLQLKIQKIQWHEIYYYKLESIVLDKFYLYIKTHYKQSNHVSDKLFQPHLTRISKLSSAESNNNELSAFGLVKSLMFLFKTMELNMYSVVAITHEVSMISVTVSNPKRFWLVILNNLILYIVRFFLSVNDIFMHL